jgi:TolA-binding protein
MSLARQAWDEYSGPLKSDQAHPPGAPQGSTLRRVFLAGREVCSIRAMRATTRRAVSFTVGTLSLAGFLFFLLVLVGCSEPRVPMPEPGTAMIPAGTPVTSAQLSTALTAEQKRVEATEKAEAVKVARQLRTIQREAESDSKTALVKAQDKAEEIAANAVITSEERHAKLDALSATIAQAQADIEARQNAIQQITQVAGVGLANSGLPGGGLAASLLVGVGGLLWGAKKSGDAKTEKAASAAHDDAWEESKKELISLMAQMRGIQPPPSQNS